MMSLIKVEKQETAPPIFHIIISWENDIWIIGTWHGRWQRPLLWEKKQGEVLFVFCMFFILLLRDFSLMVFKLPKGLMILLYVKNLSGKKILPILSLSYSFWKNLFCVQTVQKLQRWTRKDLVICLNFIRNLA